MIEARASDLYSDPPETLTEAENILARRQAPLFELGAALSGAAGPALTAAGRSAGVAFGLAHRLSCLAHDRARGRSILPADLLAGEGLPATAGLDKVPDARLHRVVLDLQARARRHLEAARQSIPPPTAPVFLPLAVVNPLLRRIEQRGAAILHRDAALSDLEMLAHIAGARIRGKV
jgi:phytoene synthase